MPVLVYYVIAIVGPVSFLIRPFMARYRQGPRWIRTAHFLAAPFVAAWGVTGILLISYRGDFSRFTLVKVDHFYWLFLGVILGITTLLLLSPDYHELRGPSRNADV